MLNIFLFQKIFNQFLPEALAHLKMISPVNGAPQRICVSGCDNFSLFYRSCGIDVNCIVGIKSVPLKLCFQTDRIISVSYLVLGLQSCDMMHAVRYIARKFRPFCLISKQFVSNFPQASKISRSLNLFGFCKYLQQMLTLPVSLYIQVSVNEEDHLLFIDLVIHRCFDSLLQMRIKLCVIFPYLPGPILQSQGPQNSDAGIHHVYLVKMFYFYPAPCCLGSPALSNMHRTVLTFHTAHRPVTPLASA